MFGNAKKEALLCRYNRLYCFVQFYENNETLHNQVREKQLSHERAVPT